MRLASTLPTEARSQACISSVHPHIEAEQCQDRADRAKLDSIERCCIKCIDLLAVAVKCQHCFMFFGSCKESLHFFLSVLQIHSSAPGFRPAELSSS